MTMQAPHYQYKLRTLLLVVLASAVGLGLYRQIEWPKQRTESTYDLLQTIPKGMGQAQVRKILGPPLRQRQTMWGYDEGWVYHLDAVGSDGSGGFAFVFFNDDRVARVSWMF